MAAKKTLGDSRWSEQGAGVGRWIGLTTFGILVLELALIHWTSSQIRVFASINNIVLIADFLGMGWGWRSGGAGPGWC